jgi:hypothetical protein
MRLWLFGRNWLARRRSRSGSPGPDAEPRPATAEKATPPGSHRRTGAGASRRWAARPAREAWPGSAPAQTRPGPAPSSPVNGGHAGPKYPTSPMVGSTTTQTRHPRHSGTTQGGPPGPSGPAVGVRTQRHGGGARAAVREAPADVQAAATAVQPQTRTQQAKTQQAKTQQAETQEQWYDIAARNRRPLGWRDCGSLEPKLHREWADLAQPPPEAVTAINRLADLPPLIKDRLAAGLDAIYVGGGGVPDLDDMGKLSGVPLPSGRATWDACAGAYGDKKIVVGSRPSPTPDVMCHEIGHALDDIDGPPGQWQSDSQDFCALYDSCLPHMVSNLHRQRGILGRREFFADAFAAIASRQRPALVDMLGGDTRSALNVMLYFNVRYGI